MLSCGKTQAYAPVDMGTVMQAVQSYGQGHKPGIATPSTAARSTSEAGAPTLTADDSTNYQNHIKVVMAEEQFAELEKEAQLARTSQTVYPGDVQKISAFYAGVTAPATGDKASEEDWKEQFAALKKWVAAYPSSATARIATAETYVNYAWVARGTGYSSTVSGSGWSLFDERLNAAKALLIEAAKLKEKCPEWYSVMFNVALGDGWDEKDARELLERAALFEPGFDTYYTQYAYHILPKWHGEEGETAAFAEEISQKIGGVGGSILYYEIAAQSACQCDKDRDSMDGLSWPKIKQGFEDLRKTYGVTNLSWNRIAYMAYSAGDRETAQKAFSVIGSESNHSVWNSPQSFETARNWAAGL